MQAGFGVEVLARQAQVVGDGVECNIGLAEGQVVGGPDHGAAGVGHALGRAQVIVVVVVNGVVGINLGQGLAV